MNKSSIGIVILAMMFLVVCSHQKSSAQLYYGGKAGMNSFKLYGGDTYGGVNNKPGISGGLIIGYKLKVDFNVQAELLYSQKGMKQKFSEHLIANTQGPGGIPITFDTLTKYANTLTLTYIELPILIKKSFSLGKGITPYHREVGIVDLDLFVGPYFGYLLGSSASFSSLQSASKIENDTVRQSVVDVEQPTYHSFRIGQANTINVDSTMGLTPSVMANYLDMSRTLSKGLNPIDIGIILGGGLSMEISPSAKLFVDARYCMGLFTIDKTYFNNVTYTVIPGGDTDPEVSGIHYQVYETRKKLDLKNKGLAFNFGFILYLN